MIRLIVNADDLGSGVPRDRGIFTAFRHGIVTSASLLANGPSFAAAAREAIDCGLPVGVHLNLSEGSSLTGTIAGLTDAAGNFPGKTGLRGILRNGSFDQAAVHRELLVQVVRVVAAGITPDHLDTHQHCLLFPTLTGIVADVATVTGIRALRLPFPAEPAGGCPGEADGAACQVDLSSVGDIDSAVVPKTDFPRKSVHSPKPGHPPAGLSSVVANELALHRQLAPAARDTLHTTKLWTPDGLWGMPLLNRLNEATLGQTIAAIPCGTWELMVHPGHCDPLDPFGGPEREMELAALTAPTICQLIVERGIELTTFGDCACGC
jgi:predicted glycoside hydrolase/deacetylase ChbG (UPF0249 family)